MKLSEITINSHKDEFGNLYDMTLMGTYDAKKFGLVGMYKIYLGETITKSSRTAYRLFIKISDAEIRGISVDNEMIPSDIKQKFMYMKRKI